MTESVAGAAVCAVRFPTTVRALRSLGLGRRTRIPWGFFVDARGDALRFAARRSGAVFFELPRSAIQAITVAETRSRPPYPTVALAIIVRVRTPAGSTDLPVVPLADDGARSLTRNDDEVRTLAQRLSRGIGPTSADRGR